MTFVTKKHICDVVLSEITKDKPQIFSIMELAKRANVARSTMYYQFSSMNDVYSYLLNTHFFDSLLEKECHSEFINELGTFIDKNPTLCNNLVTAVDRNKRYEYLYNKLNDYLLNKCTYLTANRIDAKIYEKEIAILAEYFIFQLELWFKNKMNKQDFVERMHQFFEITRKNIIRNIKEVSIVD